MRRTTIKNQNDQHAASIRFGVEIETTIPTGTGIVIGNYHNAIDCAGSYRTTDGRMITAPRLANGKTINASRDGSISYGPGEVACEFATPILRGEEGIQFLADFCAFLRDIGAKVNRSCGLHVTISATDAANGEDTLRFTERLVSLTKHFTLAVYGQTGTDRHLNHYCPALPENAEDLVRNGNATMVGRGICNLNNLTAGRIEFRAFAATTSTAKVLHHVATVLGLASRAASLTSVRPFKTTASRKLETSTAALARLYKLLGWKANPYTPTAHGVFGITRDMFPTLSAEAIRLCAKWDSRYAPRSAPTAR